MSGVKPDPNQGELFDITKNFHGGADTSKAAHKSVTPNVRAQQRQRVLSAIKPGGSTCDEVEVALGDVPSSHECPYHGADGQGPDLRHGQATPDTFRSRGAGVQGHMSRS